MSPWPDNQLNEPLDASLATEAFKARVASGLAAHPALAETPLMPESLTLSVDALKTFGKCPKKYELQTLKRMRWPSDTRNFTVGRQVHKWLDYQAYPSLKSDLQSSGLFNTLSPDAKRGVLALAQYAPATSWPVLASEWGFNLKLTPDFDAAPSQAPVQALQAQDLTAMDSVFIRGRIDRLALMPLAARKLREASQDTTQNETQGVTNGVAIIDWKTGTAIPKSPETDWQTLVYALAVYQARAALGLPDLRPEAIRFLYVGIPVRAGAYAAPLQEVWVHFDTQKLARAHALVWAQVERIVAATRLQQFALPQRCPDKWCALRPVCGIEAQEFNASEQTAPEQRD
ncbi:MAG: PD-(D/E)XK nuclease family protein [Vampirovibrionales bacterium]|nr:PD-(D/E)XK nuclease family protein [Vampirovibrionales bacterium]